MLTPAPPAAAEHRCTPAGSSSQAESGSSATGRPCSAPASCVQLRPQPFISQHLGQQASSWACRLPGRARPPRCAVPGKPRHCCRQRSAADAPPAACHSRGCNGHRWGLTGSFAQHGTDLAGQPRLRGLVRQGVPSPAASSPGDSPGSSRPARLSASAATSCGSASAGSPAASGSRLDAAGTADVPAPGCRQRRGLQEPPAAGSDAWPSAVGGIDTAPRRGSCGRG